MTVRPQDGVFKTSLDNGPDVLVSLAERAIENGWPAEDVAAILVKAVGPVVAPAAHALIAPDHAASASKTLHQRFAEAAGRL